MFIIEFRGGYFMSKQLSVNNYSDLKIKYWNILFISLLLTLSAKADDVKHITPVLINHGRIKENTKITDQILFINTSKKNIRIEKIFSSCGCTTTEYNQEIISSGDTVKIDYSLNTAGFKGVIRKTITIYFEDKNFEPITYTIQADIYKLVDIEPRYLDFLHLDYNPDKTVTKTLTISNEQHKELTVKKIYSNNKYINIEPDSFILKPNSSKSVTVRYTPVQKGYTVSQIIVESDYSENPKYKISTFIQYN